MLVSLVLGLGLEHFCPWPRECLSSERLSLALASSLMSSTPPLGVSRRFWRAAKKRVLSPGLSCATNSSRLSTGT